MTVAVPRLPATLNVAALTSVESAALKLPSVAEATVPAVTTLIDIVCVELDVGREKTFTSLTFAGVLAVARIDC